MADLRVRNEGTIFILHADTDEGRAWIDEHLVSDDTIRWCGGVVVEHRYIADIVAGAQNDGLEVI